MGTITVTLSEQISRGVAQLAFEDERSLADQVEHLIYEAFGHRAMEDLTSGRPSMSERARLPFSHIEPGVYI